MHVLFVDPDHGPRSQMAAALLRQAAGERMNVASAGTEPSGRLDDVAEILAEVGVAGFTPARNKLASTDRPPELLIAVCEEGCAACPYLPGSGQVRRWPFPDPREGSASERGQLLRRIRDDLRPLVRELARELSGSR
jgi:protein-tyrosine-phosphatase